MMKNLILPLVVSTVCSLSSIFTVSAHAADTEAPPKFQVELIVFESLALKGWTEEYWPENLNIMDLGEDELSTAPRVAPKYLMLNNEVSKMTTRIGYHVLFHQAWIVDALPEDQSKPMLVSVLPEDDNDSRLEGTLRFYKSRYPHVVLNLELEHKIPYRIRDEFAKNENLPEDQLPEFWRFQLHESRKINSHQLHYIDHPVFGALVEIKYLPNYKKGDMLAP